MSTKVEPKGRFDGQVTKADPGTRCYYCAPQANAATVVVHDARGCVGCCEVHHRWRLSTSLVTTHLKHDCTLKEPPA